MTSTADRIITALHEFDADYAAYLLTNMAPREVRKVALELARRVPTELRAPDTAATYKEALDQAIVIAAGAFGTKVEDILSGDRRQPALEARQVACYVAYLLGMSYAATGRHMGRDHTTVISSVSRVGEKPRLRNVAQRIAEQLGWDREAEAS